MASFKFPDDYPWSPTKLKTDIELIREHCRTGTPVKVLSEGETAETPLLMNLMDELEAFRHYGGTPSQVAEMSKVNLGVKSIGFGQEVQINREHLEHEAKLAGKSLAEQMTADLTKHVESQIIKVAQELVAKGHEILDIKVIPDAKISDRFSINVKFNYIPPKNISLPDMKIE